MCCTGGVAVPCTPEDSEAPKRALVSVNQNFYFHIYEREFLFDKARARARARVMLRVQIGTGCDYIFASGTGARFD